MHVLAGLGWSVVTVAASGFLLGCRHGLDWDHVAAITDLAAAGTTSSVPHPAGGGRRRRLPRLGRVTLAVWYCLGHGLVIALLGTAVGLLGIDLPPAADRAAECVVGATLIALGAVVLWQLGRDRSAYRHAGRWRLVVGTVRTAWARARRRGRPAGALEDLGPRSAFAIGLLHGTGAETPTQVVIFASAGASGSRAAAALILLSFVAGLVVSDLGIAAAWIAGLAGGRRTPLAQLGLGTLTGLSSLAIGTLFLLGRSTMLPALFGG